MAAWDCAGCRRRWYFQGTHDHGCLLCGGTVGQLVDLDAEASGARLRETVERAERMLRGERQPTQLTLPVDDVRRLLDAVRVRAMEHSMGDNRCPTA